MLIDASETSVSKSREIVTQKSAEVASGKLGVMVQECFEGAIRIFLVFHQLEQSVGKSQRFIRQFAQVQTRRIVDFGDLRKPLQGDLPGQACLILGLMPEDSNQHGYSRVGSEGQQFLDQRLNFAQPISLDEKTRITGNIVFVWRHAQGSFLQGRICRLLVRTRVIVFDFVAVGKIQQVAIDSSESEQHFVRRSASHTGYRLEFFAGFFKIHIGASGHQQSGVQHAIFDGISERRCRQ